MLSWITQKCFNFPFISPQRKQKTSEPFILGQSEVIFLCGRWDLNHDFEKCPNIAQKPLFSAVFKDLALLT